MPMLICFVTIYIFSSQDSGHSNDLSRIITEKIAGIFFRDFSSMNTDFQNTIIFELNIFIRKAAHFSVYLMMSIFIYAEVALWLKKYFFSGIVSVGICMLYAVTDEIHQSFVPGRTPLVKDVFIDSCGAIIGAFICFLIISAVYFIKSHCKK